MVRTILITGANSGLGKDAARQLALLDETEKIYLACRNPQKAEAAKRDLEESTGRNIFEIVIMDTSNLDSVRNAVNGLEASIDAVILNAGGVGGKTAGELTEDGVTSMFATNVLGHVVFLEKLLEAKKLNKVALYAGSEAARGIPKMGMKRPNLQTSSVEEFTSIIDGSYFGKKFDPMEAYAYVKYIAALWMSSLSRQFPEIRFVTMSPGGTSGTAGMDELPPFMRFMFKNLGVTLMPLFGLMHKLEKGAKRYVDGVTDESFESGVFYGSKAPVLTGPVIDQGELFSDLKVQAYQDNANRAIHRFIEAERVA